MKVFYALQKHANLDLLTIIIIILSQWQGLVDRIEVFTEPIENYIPATSIRFDKVSGSPHSHSMHHIDTEPRTHRNEAM